MSTLEVRITRDTDPSRWLGELWLCPDCGKTLRKPPNRIPTGERFHSYHCLSPLVRAKLTLIKENA